MSEKEERYVSWKVFTISVTILISIGGFLFRQIGQTSAELQTYKESVFSLISSLKSDVTQVQTDVSWIKGRLEKAEISK